jgi:hypothetical protein
VTGAIVGILVATNGTFLGPLIPMGYAYFLIQKWYRKTSTELQRINRNANSPIFFTTCKSSFDTMNASYVLVQLAGSWLGLRLDVLGGLMGAFIGGVAVGSSSSGFISAGCLIASK